jgi:WD40 repeat protein
MTRVQAILWILAPVAFLGGPAPSEARAQESGRFQADAGVHGLGFGRDGKTLLSLATEASQLWDVRTGKLLRVYKQFLPKRAGELPLVAPFALSPDCRLVAVGSLYEPGLSLLEVLTGRELPRPRGLAVEELVNTSLSFSADGRLLALGGVPGTIHIWETATGAELHRLRWQDMENSVLAFSADRRILAAGSRHGRMSLWDVATGKQLRTLGREQPFETIGTLKFSDGAGSLLASATANDQFRIWNVERGEPRFELPENEFVSDVEFSPDGRLLASWGVADGEIRIRDVATWQPRVLEGHSEGVTIAAFSPDGKTLVSASRDRTLRLWDVETRMQRLVHRQDERAVEFVAWSGDGKMLASVPGPENRIQLWDPATGAEIVPGSADRRKP